LREELVDLNQF